MLPIGAYEPRWFMRRMHMNPEDAMEAYRALRGPYADVPSPTMMAIHWGTFRLTDEPAPEPPERIRRLWKEAGLAEEKLWILKHGETRQLGPITEGLAPLRAGPRAQGPGPRG
jgi:N-acyl-phosphatidylethanolamine-hydrolysing phospholipase D